EFTVTFECDIGHEPVNSRASKYVTCERNQWTSLELECTKKSCGSPPDFDNGRYEKEGILFGDKITAVCNTVYMLDGLIKDRWCRDQGWDGRDPVCEVVKCKAPPAIVNGQFGEEPLDSYEYQQVVSYRCNSGLSLIGSSTLHCSEDGIFKPDPPKCLAQCTQPSFPSKNVVVSGSTVTFECDIGHKPVNSRASKYVTCEGNQWTSLELECTKKSCGSPPEFHNGRYEKEGILFGNKITAVCNTGYMLDGLIKDRWCRDQGWDGRDPVCEVVKCKAPPAIVNGQLGEQPLDSYEYQQVVSYRCNSGLSLIGSSTLHCSDNGTFIPDPPKCLDVCPKPEIPHAYRSAGRPPPYILKNFLEYKCDDGYTMKGDSHILCTENGWDPKPPKCIALPTTTTTSTIVTSTIVTSTIVTSKARPNKDQPSSSNVPRTLGIVFGVLIVFGLAIGGVFGYKKYRAN
ncbi:hypothetical protein PO909_014025, partial [Leuciscus waleckii]